ncbi:NAD(P)-binding protein [Piedraia hortae CBS 480.64]|uniref:Probable quinone oxidoreductase n=1 Tax=Piedraia hortae CBS 480.64 TaxID=1314780 RepID=A0A6A7C2G3_9PEZI|nr:NAD(P)-binding protein [Piedraia hortae CBS 480.64]
MADQIPKEMKGVLIDKTGGTEVLQYLTNLPVPEAGDGQVVVKNDYIGINYIDTYFRTGLYAAEQFPLILGREAEGTVVKVGPGEVYGLKVGDKVAYMSESTYAEYTAAKASKVVKWPFDSRVGAASLLQGLTALTLIRESHHVQKGDWVLVHAAAGGTGLLLCQLLKAVGANVIGTASTPEKLEAAKRAGATHVINYTKEDVKAEVMALTDNKGCIAVFDGVGKSTFDLSLECVARKGTLVSFGNASGIVPPVPLAKLVQKNNKLVRPTLMNYITEQEEFETYAKDLLKFIENGELEVKIHKVYPLSEVAQAHSDLEGRKTSGKLLLDPTK